MALSNIEMIRLMVADTASSPFYPILSDEEIESLLEYNKGNVRKTTIMSAISIAGIVAGIPIRERTGDIEVWNNMSSNYLKFLDFVINSPMDLSLSGLVPWSGNSCKHPLDNIKDPCEVRCCPDENTNCC